MKRYFPIVLTLFIAFFSASAPVFSGEEAGNAESRAFTPPAEFPEDFSAGLLDRETVTAEAAKLTTETYPNADTVLVDKRVWIRYREDGTFVQWDDNYTKILTEKGKRDWQTVSSWYTQPYNTTHFKTVELIKPDGTVKPVDLDAKDPETGEFLYRRDLAEPSQMNSNITNPRNRIVQVSVPGIEVGDVLHYVMVDYFTKTRVPDTFSDYVTFESTRPIKHMVYEIFGPKERPLKSIALKAEVKGTVAHATGEKDGLLHYRWEVRDVPRMFPEPNMPAVHTVVQRLIVSTIPDWRFISKWYWELSKPHFETNEAIRKQVAELTQGIEDKRKKLEAVFYWVSQNVRYVGITPEEEAPGYEPHDVTMTFEARHGVCRDKAALLVAMLREAGFEAFPTLIHNGPKKDEEVPTPYFNHAVVAARDEDGSYILMDPTDENTRQIFPGYLNNQSYLVATPEGDTLKTSPIVPAEENMMEIATTGSISATGDLNAESVLVFNGINDNIYRGYFSHVKPEVRRRLFEGRIKDAAPGARLVGYEIEPLDMQDMSKTLTVRLRFQAEDVLVSGGGVTLLPLPRLGTGIGWVNYVLGKTGLEKRNYPLLTETACGVKETLALDLAPELGEVKVVPSYETVQSETIALEGTLSVTVPDGKKTSVLSGESRFLLKAVEWSPEQYLGLKDTLKAIEYDLRKMPILTAGETEAGLSIVGADTLIESVDVNYTLTSASEWTETRTVRRKILTYAGKKRHGDLKLHYNPVWETVTLDKAVVTLPDGTTKAISEKEINIMDAPWVGAAPRYPAGKILVANLPGVEVGSIIEYTITTAHKDKPFFAMSESFRNADPIVKKTVTWTGPENLVRSLYPDVTGTVHVSKQNEDGTLTYRWSDDNVPGIVREDSLPPLYAFAPTIGLSTGTWSDYAKAVHDVFANNTADQAAATAKAKELTAEADTNAEKLVAIRNFLAENVRPAGPAYDALPLTALSPADTTLADGYGNAADRAVLLSAMLTAAGFTPEFVLVSSASRVPKLAKIVHEHPDVSWLSTVLVRVTADGKTIYLGDTDQYDVLGATGHDGRTGIRLPTGEIFVIHAADNAVDRTETTYAITLAEDGSARIERSETFYGNAYGRYRKHFAEMPPEERRRWHQEAVARISQAAVSAGELQTGFDSYPGTLSYAVTVPTFAVRDGENLYFELPDSLHNFLRMRGDTRVNPLYIASPVDQTLRFTLTGPESFRNARLLPSAFSSWFPGIDATVTVDRDPAAGTYAVTQTLSIDPLLVPAEQYAKLQDIYRALSHPAARTVLLRKE